MKATFNSAAVSTETFDTSKSCSLLPPLHTIMQVLVREEASTTFTAKRPDQSVFMKETTHSSTDAGSAAEASEAQYPTEDPPIAPNKPQAKAEAEIWRRPPKRWGLADWPRDDATATERRREQNRVAQRRFREKRHRVGAYYPDPPASSWAGALLRAGCGAAAPPTAAAALR
jgi:hypothetical protein